MSLDLLSLTNVLEQANGSERGQEQKLAENKLKEWETQPGYHYLLQTVYNDLSLPLQTRWLAVINFKNGIDKYWRSSRKNALSSEEKNSIKSRLFDLIDEPNRQLSIQNAHAISRVCRFDFPQEWPNLFDQLEVLLQDSIKEENNIKIHNLLLILNQILKYLSMAKIGRTRPALQSKIPIITPLLIKIYTTFFNEWAESLDFVGAEVGYIALKCLKRIVVDVLDCPHQTPEIVEFLSVSIKHFQALVENYDKYAPSEVLEKYIKCYAKIYHLLAKTNPTNLILLPSSKEILFTLLNILQDKASTIYNNDDSDDLWEFISIKTLLIFKSLINFLFKRGAVLTLKSKSSKADVENAIKQLTTQFFSEDLIKSLTDLLINYYIKLRPVDLEAWVNEPEEWANDEVNQNYEYQIRQCAENFFQDLINNFKDLLVPYILNKVQNEFTSYNEASTQNILIKDSIFSIFQLGANSIYEIIEFNNLFETVFLPEALKNDLVQNKLIKRRVCLLINEWTSLNVITSQNIQKIYSLLLNLLDPSNPINDKVVNLTAIQALKSIINEWEFKKVDFKPYIKEFTGHLLRLVDSMELTESKLFLLNTIADLVSKTNPLISVDELDQLLTVVPKFWDESNNSNEMILKNSLLRILKNLIISLNENSASTWSIALPLVRVCCSPLSEHHSLLSEDGYELWLAILQFFPINQSIDFNHSLIQDINDFYVDALLNQTEILPMILEIFRSYVILIPELVVNEGTKEFIIRVFKILADYLPKMRDDILDVTLSILEIIILQNYNDEVNYSKLLSLLVESQLLQRIIENIIDDSQSPLTVTKMLLIAARLSSYEPSKILKVFEFMYPSESERPVVLTKFVNIWYARMEFNVGNPRNRKIHVFGLTSLLKTGHEVFFNDFAILVTLWISAMEEINETGDGDCEKYHSNYLYEFHYNDDLSLQENGEYRRFQQLFKSKDPVHTTNLKNYITETLAIVKNVIGENNYKAITSKVDSNIIENFEYFLNLNHINNPTAS